MRLNVTLSGEALAWLRGNPRQILAFSEALGRVCADERAVLMHSEAIKEPGNPHMLRCFRFGDRFIAIVSWDLKQHRLRIVRCRPSQPDHN